MTNSRDIAHSIERSPVGQQSTRDLSHVYDQLHTLKNQESPTAFQATLKEVNQQLVKDNILPNLKITGIDDTHHISTQNTKDGLTITQNADSVKVGASGSENSAKPASGADNLPLQDQLLAKAFHIPITANKDGSYDVQLPDAGKAVAGILGTVMNGLGLGDGDSGNGSPIPGMNSLLAQAWKGWDMPAPQEQPEAPPPAEQPSPDAPW